MLNIHEDFVLHIRKPQNWDASVCQGKNTDDALVILILLGHSPLTGNVSSFTFWILKCFSTLENKANWRNWYINLWSVCSCLRHNIKILVLLQFVLDENYAKYRITTLITENALKLNSKQSWIRQSLVTQSNHLQFTLCCSSCFKVLKVIVNWLLWVTAVCTGLLISLLLLLDWL